MRRGVALFSSPVRGLASLPRHGKWQALPQGERAAWELLGWSASRWDGQERPPLSSLQSWSELGNAQQAAAQHGLGWSAAEWDAHRDDQAGLDVVVENQQTATASSSAPPPAPTTGGGVVGTVAGAAWSVAKRVAPLVGAGLSKSKHPAAALAGALLANAPTIVDSTSQPVTVDGVETVLYLDDSGSMTWTGEFRLGTGTRLQEGRLVLGSLAPLLSGPTRVLKFGSAPTVLSPREEGNQVSTTLVGMQWDGSSGGTYLWKMIEDDVMSRYRPGSGKLRLVVVTDGQDTLSPAEYNGVRGMDPMMRVLLREGFDIEWHIVVLGEVERKERYEALAGATGGSFLSTGTFDADEPMAAAFLDAVSASGEQDHAASRRARQRQYELEARRGKAERFEWYRALPEKSS